jgi:hypothetical protein
VVGSVPHRGSGVAQDREQAEAEGRRGEVTYG